MPRAAVVSDVILDGEGRLYKRPGTDNYQVTFKVNNRWIIKTTGTADRKQAIQKAQELYYQAKFADQMGLPVLSKTFKSVAQAVIRDYAGAAKGSKEAKYVQRLNAVWIPVIGNKNVNNVTEDDLKAAVAKIFELNGGSASKATVKDYYTALNLVFAKAVKAKHMAALEIPEPYIVGEKAQPRPAFTTEEYNLLRTKVLDWCNEEGIQERVRARRELLSVFMYFVASSGCRPGTEVYDLKWGACRYVEKDGVTYAEFYVSGKTGPRQIITDAAVLQLMETLKAKANKPPTNDDYVFCLPNGSRFINADVQFKALLEFVGLRDDSATGQARTLYSLRHAYATEAIVSNRMSIMLLTKQMGTSAQMLQSFYSKATTRAGAEQIVPNPIGVKKD